MACRIELSTPWPLGLAGRARPKEVAPFLAHRKLSLAGQQSSSVRVRTTMAVVSSSQSIRVARGEAVVNDGGDELQKSGVEEHGDDCIQIEPATRD